MIIGGQDKISIALIENNRFIRSIWEMIFSEKNDFKLTGSYSSCEEAFKDDDIGKANLVLLDIKLPGMSGIDGIKYLKDRYPEQILIVSTMYDDDDNIFDAILAGAAGFLPKKISAEYVISSILEIIKGGSPMTPNVARIIISVLQKSADSHGKIKDELTSSEWKLLSNISAGKSYSTIAEELNVNAIQVLQYIRDIYNKIQSGFGCKEKKYPVKK